MAEQQKDRAWRLTGYAKTEEGRPTVRVHTSICPSDAELDDAMSRLEANPDIVRITAAPA